MPDPEQHPPTQTDAHATEAAEHALDHQRAEHERRDDAAPEIVDDGIAGLVNNTGHDGGAASG